MVFTDSWTVMVKENAALYVLGVDVSTMSQMAWDEFYGTPADYLHKHFSWSRSPGVIMPDFKFELSSSLRVGQELNLLALAVQKFGFKKSNEISSMLAHG